MRRLRFLAPMLLLAAISLASGSLTVAQNPARRTVPPKLPPLKTGDTKAHLSLSDVTPTPQMWFYEQERRRYEDPQQAVRANAEFKSAQRRQRLAALQWFGHSTARPNRHATPTHNTSTPHWGLNATGDAAVGGGMSRPTVVLAPEMSYVR